MKTLSTIHNYQAPIITVDEMMNPEIAIARFFDHHNLQQRTNNIREFYQAWLYRNANHLSDEDIHQNMAFFYELAHLLAICDVIAKQNKA